MTTTTLSEKIDTLRTIYEITESNSEDYVKFESQNFQDWYEYWGDVCYLSYLSLTSWIDLTYSGKEAVEQAYLSFQNLVRLPKGKKPFPDELWRKQDFHYQEDYPFNEFKKPEVTLYV